MQLDLLGLETVPAAAIQATPETVPVMEEAAFSDESALDEKAAGAFKNIREAADALGVPQHVLRFWESRFKQIKPLKLRGGRRYYRPQDMDILFTIKKLLYKQGYTIEGAKKAFSAHNEARHTVQAQPLVAPAATAAVAAPPPERLAALRQELMALRDTLKPYVF